MPNCINGQCSGGNGGDGRMRMFGGGGGRGGLFYPAGNQGLGNGDPVTMCGNQSNLPSPCDCTCDYKPTKKDITLPLIPCPAIDHLDFIP